MRTVRLCVVDHTRPGVRNEAESTRSLGLGILHYHNVNDFSPFLEVTLEGFVVRSVVETADEELSRAFWLTDCVLESKNYFR